VEEDYQEARVSDVLELGTPLTAQPLQQNPLLVLRYPGTPDLRITLASPQGSQQHALQRHTLVPAAIDVGKQRLLLTSPGAATLVQPMTKTPMRTETSPEAAPTLETQEAPPPPEKESSPADEAQPPPGPDTAGDHLPPAETSRKTSAEKPKDDPAPEPAEASASPTEPDEPASAAPTEAASSSE